MSELTKGEQLKKQLYYDPDPRGCEFCDDWYKCDDCPQRQEEEEKCDYTGDECIDSSARLSGCIGCEVIAPPSKEELEETECCICQEKKPVDYEGYCQSCHDEIAARNVREGTKENTTP